ncbi:GAF domain-containing protein [Anaerobacillus sp. 1_MG-2023]|uniref:GAF domain-containing protein n=1 Tax=Anaerobacillus sp. 1_MG-2023 TaxID=3062655 RepID=UPI0026E11566|nr:GAF domain-containing protein [Anaerobacillus sp. 1_MG-2023]MDO6657385.1 GAF domain-containing protein [Anaerobacillus sp. 1_MG-2023]
MNPETETPKRELKEGLSPPIKILCYIAALFLMSLMLYIFSTFIASTTNLFFKRIIGSDRQFNFFDVIAVVGALYMIISLSYKLGNYWRSSDSEIGTSVTNLPNPFRDPSFKRGSIMLKRDYWKLEKRYDVNIKLTRDLNNKYEKVLDQIDKFKLRLNVLLRHHENASRLIESLAYTIQTNDYSLSKVLNDTLSECITVLERDQSDKSISLFEVEDNKLVIRDGVRINAESVVKRSFCHGEGFAGFVWEKGRADYINEIDYEDDARFNSFYQSSERKRYRSIMGIPLIVNENTIGVLCIQSESTYGFCKDDLRSLEFYAHLCTLIMIYGKIKLREGGSEE